MAILAPNHVAARAEAKAARGLASLASTNSRLPPGVSEVTLYQYEICPYCCKVKAYLDFAQIPYKVVEINPIAKKEMKPLAEKFGKENVGKVPVVVLSMGDGTEKLLKESSDIIDELSAATKTAPVGDAAEQAQWREWVDERWVKVVTVNIYRTVGESLQTFEYMTSLGKFSAFESTYVKYGGGLLMYMVGKKMRGKYKIADGKDANPRDDLYTCANEWSAALGRYTHSQPLRREFQSARFTLKKATVLLNFAFK